MSYNDLPPLGQAVKAASLPVTLASDQEALPLPTDAATETKQDVIIGHLDGVETAIASTNTKQDTIIGHLDGVETTLTAIETATEAVESYFKAEDTAAVSGDKGIPMLAMRQSADTTSTDADGDYTLMKIDEEGRVKVATKPASFAIVTGNITTNGQTAFADVSRASNVMLSMVAASLVGHNVTFEGSIDSTNGTDGNWFGIQVIRSNANTIELTSGVLAATPGYAWEASVNGLSFIRVRATAHTSGTATWKFQRGSYATEPIPAAQVSATQPVSGTVTATVANATLGAGTVTQALPTAVADVASAAITTTTTTAAFTPTWGSGYQIVIPVTVVSGTTPTLSVRIEESDDAGTNWYARYTFPTITATGIYRSPILRLRGNRVRYVQTITGTTPSFTRAINRNQRQDTRYTGYQGKLVSAATTNATSVLAAPCEVTKLTVSNTNSSARYLKVYDKASAPTVGTDIPVATYVIPGATTGGGSNIPLSVSDSFQLGFAFALTTGATDADTGAVAANEIIVNYSIG